MNFKRHDVQEFIEYNLGCSDISQWKSYIPSLLTFDIDANKKQQLENCIESDIFSYFYKSVYTFTQALNNIHNKNYNWSVVQLYYSCFYAIRADILLSNYCIVRCSGLYFTENKIGEKFQPFKLNKIRGDHQLSIALLKKLKSNHIIVDDILDNLLEGIDPYTWMMKHRERVNYQLKNFTDPNTYELFNHIDSYFKAMTIFDLLFFYKQSNYNICFDLDHSIISIPFKKIIQIKEKIETKYKFEVFANIKHYKYIINNLTQLGLTSGKIKLLIQ